MNTAPLLDRAEALHRKLADLHARQASAGELEKVFLELQPLHDELLDELTAHQSASADAGLLLSRLRMDADYRARRSDAEGESDVGEVWEHYAALKQAFLGPTVG